MAETQTLDAQTKDTPASDDPKLQKPERSPGRKIVNRGLLALALVAGVGLTAGALPVAAGLLWPALATLAYRRELSYFAKSRSASIGQNFSALKRVSKQALDSVRKPESRSQEQSADREVEKTARKSKEQSKDKSSDKTVVIDGDGDLSRGASRKKLSKTVTKLAGHDWSRENRVTEAEIFAALEQPSMPRLGSKAIFAANHYAHRDKPEPIDRAKTASLHAERMNHNIEARIPNHQPSDLIADGKSAIVAMDKRYGALDLQNRRSEVVLGAKLSVLNDALTVPEGKEPSKQQLRLASALVIHAERVSRSKQMPGDAIKLDITKVASAGLVRDALSRMGIGGGLDNRAVENFNHDHNLQTGGSLQDIGAVHFEAHSFKADVSLATETNYAAQRGPQKVAAKGFNRGGL